MLKIIILSARWLFKSSEEVLSAASLLKVRIGTVRFSDISAFGIHKHHKIGVESIQVWYRTKIQPRRDKKCEENHGWIQWELTRLYISIIIGQNQRRGYYFPFDLFFEPFYYREIEGKYVEWPSGRVWLQPIRPDGVDAFWHLTRRAWK